MIYLSKVCLAVMFRGWHNFWLSTHCLLWRRFFLYICSQRSKFGKGFL